MLFIILAVLLYFVFFKLLLRPLAAFGQESTVQALIFSLCGTTFYLYAVTEVLSAFLALGFWGVLGSWVVFVAAGLLGTVFAARRCKRLGEYPGLLRAVCPGRVTAGGVLAAIFALCVVALSIYTVTYNWDSMRYHLPRIMSWAQNKSVAHYFTNDVRRISSPPLAEFFNLHEYLLTGSDRLFNLLQAASYLLNGYFVYKIANRLGLQKSWCVVAVLLYFSMPIAFAEAFTTQVDHLATLWLMIFVYECLRLAACDRLKNEALLYVRLLCVGLSGAFGYLTKPSVCIAMAVFAVGLVAVRLKAKDKFSVLACSLGVTVVPAVLTVLPELLRNFATFNAYASGTTGARQLVGTLNPAYLLVNFFKNLAFTLPTVQFGWLSNLLYKGVNKVSALLKVPLNDPAISEDGHPYLLPKMPDYGHDTAVNPLIVWLFLAVCAVAVYFVIKKLKNRGPKAQRGSVYYLVCSFLAFVGLLTVLRWERFETRYELGFLTLLCPFIVCFLQKMFQNRAALKNGAVGALAVACLFSGIDQAYYHANLARKQSGQLAGYFTNNGGQCAVYSELINEINLKNYKSLGLYIARGQYSYPFWPMCPGVERIEDVAGNGYNETERYDDKAFVPDCIVWVADLPENGEFEWHGVTYQKSFEASNCYLLCPKTP